MSMFYCCHIYVALYFSFLFHPCLSTVSEFGQVPRCVWAMSLGQSVLLCVPVGCVHVWPFCVAVFLCVALWPPSP